MKIQITAKTVSEAIDKALIKLDTTIDNIGHKIIQEPSKGFLGIGTKPAVVEVWIIGEEDEKEPEEKSEEKPEIKEIQEKQEIKEEKLTDNNYEAENNDAPVKERELKARTDDPCKTAEKFLNDIFSAMKMKVTVETELVDNKYLNINLKGDEIGVIIGKRGQTLDSLQ